VPLAQIAEFRIVEAPAQVSREKRHARVVAEANVRGRDLGGFVSEVRTKLAPLVRELPSGYYVEYGGQFENQQRAMRQLAVVVPIALLLIMVLLYTALGRYGTRCSSSSTCRSHWLAGDRRRRFSDASLGCQPPSLSSYSSVSRTERRSPGRLLSATSRAGRIRGRYSVKGCDLRFRPLLMTALTSFIGHLPMLYARVRVRIYKAACRGGYGRPHHFDAAHAHRASTIYSLFATHYTLPRQGLNRRKRL